jgi:hypothetical protein
MAGTGSDETRLIILRGNSASGKSSTAAEIRRRHVRRDLAIVGQDNLRRDVLREHDIPAGTNIGLIDLVARYALSHGFNVIVEGILCADHYAEMLGALIEDHQGPTYCYYFDVPFDETVKRHAAKPQASKYGGAEMRAWYRELDLLPGVTEQVIPAAMTQDETVRRIMADSGLAAETVQNSPLAGRHQPPRQFTPKRYRTPPSPVPRYICPKAPALGHTELPGAQLRIITTQNWNHPWAPLPRAHAGAVAQVISSPIFLVRSCVNYPRARTGRWAVRGAAAP